MGTLIQVSYFFAAVLFILGLKQMSSPVTARRGVIGAGVGMVIATVATLFTPQLHGFANYALMLTAIAIGGGYAWFTGKKVEMTKMPEMIALYNGMGGGAAAAIAAVEIVKALGKVQGEQTIADVMGGHVAIVAVIGALIGSVAFSGSLVAWGKLDGRLTRSSLVSQHQIVNMVLAALTLWFALQVYGAEGSLVVLVFFLCALAFGVFATVPIGGADMPVVISLFNALTGLAVGLEGYVLQNPAMIIAGIVVGSAGTLLTQLMAKAMNRSVWNVLVGGFGTTKASTNGATVEGTMKEIQAQDAGIMMTYADSVIIIPGYGMAVAQAQHKLWELVQILQQKGVGVKFAIHPVAGRMPGHMNVLLAEAGVPYDMIYDMEDINSDFPNTTVSLVIGANDVVNPSARNDESSPLYGMPILNAVDSQNVIVIKRGKGAGFSGVENTLFYADNTQMLYGDGQKAIAELIQAVKQL